MNSKIFNIITHLTVILVHTITMQSSIENNNLSWIIISAIAIGFSFRCVLLSIEHLLQNY